MSAKILNFGSINIDHVYKVPHFVRPGETLSSTELNTGLGGKGANQSVAIAQAGGQVTHLGMVNKNDSWAVELLASYGVDVSQISISDEPSGHAIIQVNNDGENSIVLHGGANQSFSKERLEGVLKQDIDYLLMQNECNLLAEAFDIAIANGIKVILNPAPMTEDITRLPLADLDTLIVNQGEAEMLTGATQLEQICDALIALMPTTRIIITLGADGATLLANGQSTSVSAPVVDVIDTTGAGDTFVGYFLAGLVAGLDDLSAVQRACLAAATAATRAGAIASIPALEELHL